MKCAFGPCWYCIANSGLQPCEIPHISVSVRKVEFLMTFTKRVPWPENTWQILKVWSVEQGLYRRHIQLWLSCRRTCCKTWDRWALFQQYSVMRMNAHRVWQNCSILSSPKPSPSENWLEAMNLDCRPSLPWLHSGFLRRMVAASTRAGRSPETTRRRTSSNIIFEVQGWC